MPDHERHHLLGQAVCGRPARRTGSIRVDDPRVIAAGARRSASERADLVGAALERPAGAGRRASTLRARGNMFSRPQVRNGGRSSVHPPVWRTDGTSRIGPARVMADARVSFRWVICCGRPVVVVRRGPAPDKNQCQHDAHRSPHFFVHAGTLQRYLRAVVASTKPLRRHCHRMRGLWLAASHSLSHERSPCAGIATVHPASLAISGDSGPVCERFFSWRPRRPHFDCLVADSSTISP